MKILFITDNFPPEVNAPATRCHAFCRQWLEYGAEVTVMTTAPNFPGGNVYKGYKNRLRHTETIDGIRVIRVGSYITANKGVLRRTLDYLSFAIMASLQGLFHSFDVVIATSPQFFTTWAARFLSLVKRKPWVFELRDLWPDSIAAVGAIRYPLLLKCLSAIEHHLYRKTDLIVANSPAFKETLVARGIETDKIKVVPNGTDLTFFTPRPKNEALLRKLGLQDRFIFGYIGTHGMAHSLDFIMDALSHSQNPSIHFLFVGDGAAKKDVVKQASHLQLTNVTFLDPIPKDQVPDYIAAIDCALVPLKNSDTFKTVIPSKIFETCAMGKPILLGVEGQVKQLIETYQAGLCFYPEERDSFLQKVNEISQNPELLDTLEVNALSLAADFNVKKMAEKMYNHLQDLTKR